MAGTVSFGGLLSGLDSQSIVEKLVGLKTSQLLRPLTVRQSALRAQQSALPSIVAQFNGLKDAAKALSDTTSTLFQTKTSTSSNLERIEVISTDSLAALGNYTISDVSQLAQSDRVVFEGVADKTAATFTTGTISITYKGVATDVVITGSNNSLQGVMNAINDADLGVTASIINDGDPTTPYRLTLTADDTGSDTTITQNIAAITGLTVDADVSSAAENEAQSALFQVNGIALQSKKNLVDDAISGVSFRLVKEDEVNTTTIAVGVNASAVGAKVASFLTAYNSFRGAIRTATRPDANGVFGPLGHDYSLISAGGDVNNALSKRYQSLEGHAYASLSQIGITADSSGNLQLNSTKFAAAMEEDPSSVQFLFQGSSSQDGIAEKVYKIADRLTAAGGPFSSRSQNIDLQLKLIDTEGASRSGRIESYRAQLLKQFNHLETVMQGLQGQQSQLTSYVNSLNALGA